MTTTKEGRGVMTLEEQTRRYQNDAEFHALVKQFRIPMEAGQFTIGECKGALNLAAYLVEAERIAPLTIGHPSQRGGGG